MGATNSNPKQSDKSKNALNSNFVPFMGLPPPLPTTSKTTIRYEDKIKNIYKDLVKNKELYANENRAKLLLDEKVKIQRSIAEIPGDLTQTYKEYLNDKNNKLFNAVLKKWGILEVIQNAKIPGEPDTPVKTNLQQPNPAPAVPTTTQPVVPTTTPPTVPTTTPPVVPTTTPLAVPTTTQPAAPTTTQPASSPAPVSPNLASVQEAISNLQKALQQQQTQQKKV